MAEQARRRVKKVTPAKSGPTVGEVQAAVEGVVLTDGKVEFMGQMFTMSDKIGLMPLMKFAHSASKGIDSTDMEGLAALYSMVKDCIDDSDPDANGNSAEWRRFERHAIEQKAEADDLMKCVQKVIEVLAARPTRQPGDSSAGRPSISQSSKVDSLTEGMVSVTEIDRR